MSWDIFEHSLTIALKNEIPSLNFFGGEPLLNPQVFLMLQTALETGLSLILATNCRPLEKESFITKFLNTTKQYKKHIVIVTARDRFHLQHFDPIEVINYLQSESYKILVQDYSNHTVALSKYNSNKQELRKLNTRWCCCESSWTDYVGVLPNGGWTICPPSLVPFGDIFTDDIREILKFKSGLPLRYKEGCTMCLKDFSLFREQFEKRKST